MADIANSYSSIEEIMVGYTLTEEWEAQHPGKDTGADCNNGL
jgi:hypothetical protein